MNKAIDNDKLDPESTDSKSAPWYDRFFGLGVKPKREELPDGERRKIYDRRDSFAQFMRSARYDKDLRVFVMEDEISVGCAIETDNFAAEDRSIKDNFELHGKLLNVLEAVPERSTNPWVIATYTEEEPLIETLERTLNYVKAGGEDRLYDDYETMLTEHFADLTSDNGIFREGQYPWRGSVRKTRILLYRKYDAKNEKDVAENATELREVLDRITNGLVACGLSSREIDASSFYRWLNPWFSHETDVKDKYLNVMENPYREDESIDGTPDFEVDLMDWILGSKPPVSGSDEPQDGTWQWGSDYVRFVPIVGSKSRPPLGNIVSNAADVKSTTDKSEFIKRPLFKRIPERCVYTLIFVVTTQDSEIDNLNVLAKASRARTESASIARDNIDLAITATHKKHKLFPAYHGLFVRGSTKVDCLNNVKKCIAEVSTEGYRCIELQDDLHALDECVRSLPFAYQPEFDSYLMRQYPMWLHDIVSLLPIWGQSNIKGFPAFIYYDRLGTPITLDPLRDKTRVAHLFMGGASGSGKSANLNYMVLMLNIIHRPKNFIVDYGGSYYLLAEYLREMGMSVKYSQCSPKNPTSFALFGEARLYLESDDLDNDDSEFDYETNEEQDEDYLTKASFTVKLMLSGGDPDSFKAISRADTTIIKRCLASAAEWRIKQADHTQLLPSDVIAALKEHTKGEEITERKIRYADMADSLTNFTMGFYGKMFNSPVDDEDEVYDVEVLDIAMLGTNTEYNDAFLLAWVGLLNRLEVDAQRAKDRGEERDTLLLNDEAHITFEVPFMPSVLARRAKVFRKEAIWMLMATQEMEDIPPEASKIISMMEWKIFMSMNRKQINELKKFVDLDEEQERLILSARTRPGYYTEGVLITEKWNPQIFRNVPPAIAMALGQTEKEERKIRHQLKEKHGLTTETEITRHVAQTIRAKRK